MSDSRYHRIIEKVFVDRYTPGDMEVSFAREDLVEAAGELGLDTPKNLGDIVYSFRYRSALPEAIRKTTSEGQVWIIRPDGTARYRFVQVDEVDIRPNSSLAETKVPNATPGMVEMYALGDEQALLAKLRYNRLLDIFTGVTCYSLQNHLRTNVPGMGQVETDEVYVGVDRRGVHYVFPVQAKGGRDALGLVQFEQDLALCEARFSALVVRPIGAQFIEQDLIALFELEETDKGLRIAQEKHYRLVPPDDLSTDEILAYRQRT